MSKYHWDTPPPHPCERLARLVGQSNFLGLLSGQESGPDTTEDAAALAMCRGENPPELLEAYWGGSILYRRSLCQVVFDEIDAAGTGIPERDRVWVKGAVFDAFELTCGRWPKPGRSRARGFKVRYEDYLATRKLAEGILHMRIGTVGRAWIAARFGNSAHP